MRQELVQATELLRHNTPEAVDQAIGLLQNTVYSFSMKLCGHREDAEDIMQDVLFRSLEHLARFPDPAALAAWLYTVTMNRCRRVRRPRAEAADKVLSFDELMPTDSEFHRLLRDESESPENRMLDAEKRDLLHQAVLVLPATLRVVLVLHDMEELSTNQVAQILDLQPGTVAVRLHRARLTLRKEMSRILKVGPPRAIRDAKILSRSTSRSKRSKRSPECRAFFRTLSEYLDGRVETAISEQIDFHMAGCPNCVAFLNDLRASIDRCRSLNAECDPAVLARLHVILTNEYIRISGMHKDQRRPGLV
jgi:RNA polymerase sigma-70 factor (ECF subfamily)